jgi:hypothetical protein
LLEKRVGCNILSMSVASSPSDRLTAVHRVLIASSLVLLAACARDTDSFSPQIVITSPSSGAVTPSPNLEVKGYVIDDTGVQKLVLNGSQDLMAKPPLNAFVGRKLIKFSIPLRDIEAGSNTFELRALDVNGREGKRELELRVDTQKPKVEIDTLSGQESTVTISGRATDNIKVSRITVNGIVLNYPPASSLPFYTTVARTRYVRVVVEDSVGNKTELVRTAPPPPPPPEPVATESNATTVTNGQVTTTDSPRRRRRRKTTTTTTQAPTQPGLTGTR